MKKYLVSAIFDIEVEAEGEHEAVEMAQDNIDYIDFSVISIEKILS